jgi:hypothetical protein
MRGKGNYFPSELILNKNVATIKARSNGSIKNRR